MSALDPDWPDKMLALIEARSRQPESSAGDDVFRVGSLWRSKRSMRLRIITCVNGDDVITRFEHGTNYYLVSKEFLLALYRPV